MLRLSTGNLQRLLIVVSALGTASCGSLLGIEDRRLRAEGDAGSSGSAGTPGSGGTTGEGGTAGTPGSAGVGLATSGGAPADCPDCVDPIMCLEQAPTAEPVSCWECVCRECGDLEGVNLCLASGVDCSAILSCIANTGCQSGQDCQMACGLPLFGVPDDAFIEVSECLRGPCAGAGCEYVVQTGTGGATGDPQQCVSRYGTEETICADCLCNQCSASVVSQCSDPSTDCDRVARCMRMSDCQQLPDCFQGQACQDVIETWAPDSMLVDELSSCMVMCPECADLASSNPRDRCGELYGDLACAPCMCNMCAEDVIRGCAEMYDCRQLWTCMQQTGCRGPECEQQCGAGMLPAHIVDGLGSCADLDCASCQMGGGTGGGPEVCDLADNDGDGVVDEGSTWQLGAWTSLFGVATGIADLRVKEIPNTEDVALAFTDGLQGAFFAIVSGNPPMLQIGPEPADPHPGESFGGLGVAAGSGRAGALFSMATPCSNCDLQMLAADTTTYAFMPIAPPTWPFAPSPLLDIGRTNSGWVSLALDDAGMAHVNWLDESGSTDGTYPEWIAPGLYEARGAIATRDEWMVVAVEISTGAALFTFDAMQQEFRGGGAIDIPSAVPELASGRPVALLPDTTIELPFVLLYGVPPEIARLSPLGDLVEYGPVPVEGDSAFDVIEVGRNFVTMAQQPGGMYIARYTETLEQPDPAMGSVQYTAPGALLRLARAGSRFLLFSDGPGGTLQVAELGCP